MSAETNYHVAQFRNKILMIALPFTNILSTNVISTYKIVKWFAKIFVY